MIKTNIWRPDTCGCQIIYQWDSDLPDDQRVHTPIPGGIDSNGKPILPIICDLHSELSTDHVKHHDIVVSENQMKNVIVNKFLEQNPELSSDNVLTKFSKDKDDKRSLNIKIPNKQQALQDQVIVDLISQKFDGKVTLG